MGRKQELMTHSIAHCKPDTRALTIDIKYVYLLRTIILQYCLLRSN